MTNIEKTLQELQEFKRMREEIDAMIESTQDAIKTAMTAENIDTLTAGAFKVTWKEVTQNRLDSAALKKAYPDIAAQYTKAIVTRPFKVA